MTGKQQTVGWLALGLIVANLLDGGLRDALTAVTQPGGSSSSGGGHPFLNPYAPNIPLIPQGPFTGLPFSPVSNPHGLPPTPNHPAQPRPVLSA